jgi:LysR substrate binding domain
VWVLPGLGDAYSVHALTPHRLTPSVRSRAAATSERVGCTVLPGTAVRDELARGSLVFRPIEQPTLCATYAIAFRQTTTEPRLRGFVDVIRDVVMALAKDGTWKGARIARPETNDPIATPASDLAAWRAPVSDAAFRALALAGD